MATQHSLAGVVQQLHTHQRGFREALQMLLGVVEDAGAENAIGKIKRALRVLEEITTDVDDAYKRASLVREESPAGVRFVRDSIGSRLREERLKLKMTQHHFGAIGGVNTDAQYKYERGSRIPKTDYLGRVALIGVDIHYVATGIRLSAKLDG